MSDPIGAILIGSYIIFSWSLTAKEQLETLAMLLAPHAAKPLSESSAAKAKAAKAWAAKA